MAAQQTDLSILSKDSGETPRRGAVSRPASRWKTRVLLPAVILLGFAGVFAYALRDSLLPATAVRVSQVVQKATLGGASGSVVAQAAGWVEPDPYPIYVPALTDGIVKEVYALEGQRVKAGEIVARLIDDDARLALDFAENELQHHQHDLCEYDAVLKAARSEWDNPVERVRAVKTGEALLAQYRADLAANTAEVAVEAARIHELEEEYRREKIASDSGALPENTTVQTALKLETQRALLKLAEARRAGIDARGRQQEAELAAAQANLKLRIVETREVEEAIAKRAAELHTIETIRVKRDEAKLRLSRTEIRSPADGVVMERMTEPGAKLYVNMNERNSAQALKLYDPKKLQVRVDVPLADAAKVGAGQHARIGVEVLRDVVFDGIVTRVGHQADISKNTLQVKVAIQNPREELKPEMLARVQFIAMDKPENAEKEPSQRLFAREHLIRNNSAWILDKGRGTAVRRMVTLGSVRQDGWIEVTSGLQPGDALIDADTSNFKDGQRVKVAEEAMAPEPMPATSEHKH